MYNIFWFKSSVHGDNFGDEIVPWLLNKMFNLNVIKPCDKLSENMLLSIGSVLWACNTSTTVWGTGIISSTEKIVKPKEICSVRGLFSRQRLIDLGYSCPKNFGDPAILCPNYYNPKINKKYKLGIIPHIVEYDTINKIYENISDIKVINLQTNNTESIINDILSCEQTISSALHGLIISIVYNIPTRWVKFSNKLYGDGVKFYDFFSSLDQEVFTRFNYKSFKTTNNKYNPVVLIDCIFNTDSMKNINTILYSTKNINYYNIHKSCPIKI